MFQPKLPLQVSPDIGIAPPQRVLDTVTLKLQGQRLQRNLDVLRRYGERIDTDSNGDLIIRGEIVAYLPSTAQINKVREQGFLIIREQLLSGLNSTVAVLRPTGRESAPEGLRRLRKLFADGVFDLNHLYNDSGEFEARGAPQTPVESRATTAGKISGSGEPSAVPRRAHRNIGLIDGGVDGGTDALQKIQIHRNGCLGREIASAHGTAVASIMVGKMGKFYGAAPGIELYAADIYCGEPTGGSVDAIAGAFAWMSRQRIPVINVSLVGPANGVLEQVVRGMIQQGHHIVAAVGNDGPAAPPLYPAAYPGVIGVTAVDAGLRVLPEASRGPQLLFAAPGANMVAARTPNGFTTVRGTSFAAPIVAGLLALLVDEVNPVTAQQALSRLLSTAFDLGPPGKDPIYGHGLVGKEVRVDPSQVNLTDMQRSLTLP